MITATSRSETTLVKDCEVGGSFLGNYSSEEDEYETTAIKEANYYKYIYGGTTDWTGVEAYDGNTYLSTKPTVN